MRPLDPGVPIPSESHPAPAGQQAPTFGVDEATEPVVTVDAPLWVRTDGEATLWSSHQASASAFTKIGASSYLRVQGPSQDGRLPVYYGGDGLFRRAGGAWVDVAAVRAVDAPPPGQVAEVDAYGSRELPDWVQTHRAATLWSGPDAQAEVLTDLPQWTFLQVAGLERGGRILVSFAGDFATRQPGIGWVDQDALGPAGEPGRWLQSHRPSFLWAGPDEASQRFTDLPQWSKLKVVEDAPHNDAWVLVEYFGDGRARLPGTAWVQRGDVGPITPPVPLPVRPPDPSQKTAQAGGQRQIQGYSFRSDAEFIEVVGQAARLSQLRTRVPASVTVAQAILESDWGRSRLTRQANNLFGIKALSAPGTAGSVEMPTWEVFDGQNVVIQQPFRAYYTLEESVDDHGWFFIRNRRYAGALAVANDAQAFAREIHAAGYATDPGYSDKLIRLMDRYNLYRFDLH